MRRPVPSKGIACTGAPHLFLDLCQPVECLLIYSVVATIAGWQPLMAEPPAAHPAVLLSSWMAVRPPQKRDGTAGDFSHC